MRLSRFILSLLTVAAIAAGAFFGVRLLIDRFAADDGGVVTAQEGDGGAGEGLSPPKGLPRPRS